MPDFDHRHVLDRPNGGPLDIIEREGDGNARLQVFSPVGMYLPKPVKLTIDQGEPHPVPYTWCLTNTCIAGAVADPKMIKEMAFGTDAATGIRGFKPLGTHDIAATCTVRLRQQGRAGKTFEQDIDE